jgi:hypothetical protein
VITRRTVVASLFLLAVFLVSAGMGVASATSTPKTYYYADAPFGTIYCAAQSSVGTMDSNRFTQSSSTAYADKDVFCQNPAPAPEGYTESRATVWVHYSNTYASRWCADTGYVNNTPNSAQVLASTAAVINGGFCDIPGYSMDVFVAGWAHVAANFGWRDNAQGYAWYAA